jgi:TolB-like protein
VLSHLVAVAVALVASASPTTPRATSTKGPTAAPARSTGPAPAAAPTPTPAPAAPPAPPPPAPAPAKPVPSVAKTKIAVMDVAGVQGVAPGTATILTNIVVADVARTGLDTVSKGDITAIIGFEKQRQILGCAGDAGCVAEIGGALGVDFMLTGQVGQIGSQYHLSLQLVETKKARVAGRPTRVATGVCGPPGVARLAPGAGRAVLPVGPAPAPAAAPGPSHRSAWIAYGIAGALLVGGGATGYVAKTRYDDLKAKQGTAGYAAAYASDRSSIRTTALAADAMFGGAAVAAGVGTWLWLRGDRAVAVVPVVGPAGASVAFAAGF